MNYLEVKIQNPADLTEILIAELSEAGYDSFLETEEGITAYVENGRYNAGELRKVLGKYLPQAVFEVSQLENKNWNEEWEKNFQPVIVEDKVMVRGSFHAPDKQYAIDIVIDPKMSFGTGHHETTCLMIRNQLAMDHRGKLVLDAGTGTGILAILASKLGAKEVFAFDIEDWAFENLKENSILNGCNNIKVGKGTIETLDLPFPSYDIILANINKNVLMKEIPAYSGMLRQDGIMILSGFYEEDVEDIRRICQASSLQFSSQKILNNWASVVFIKN